MKKELEKLAKQHVYLGTSSWKYPGWKGIVYDRKYSSEKAFNEKCLEEYAETFPTVGIDHTYYAWPLPSTFKKYDEQTPEEFRFGLKITEKVTVFKYPKLKRYGKDAGKTNELFLNAEIFEEKFLNPLAPYRKKLGPLIFEFSHFYPGTISSGHEFVERLDAFLKKIAGAGYLFAVEIRNRNWLEAPYFKTLEKHRVAHVFNSWTKMPLLQEQWLAARSYKLPAIVSRMLLNPGVTYNEAVEAYSPYDKLVEDHLAIRTAAASLIHHAIEAGIPAYVFVNNRFEGSAPLTIKSVLELVAKINSAGD